MIGKLYFVAAEIMTKVSADRGAIHDLSSHSGVISIYDPEH